jgi:hypothetical protein
MVPQGHTYFLGYPFWLYCPTSKLVFPTLLGSLLWQ